MRIRTQVTFDGVWTVFVDEALCFSGLSAAEAQDLVSVLGRLDPAA
jgi:hypothetical protein